MSLTRKKAPIKLVKNEPTAAAPTLSAEKPVLDERGMIDMPFLILVLLLVGIGLIMLFSASYASSFAENDGNAAHYFVRQAIFVGSGIVAMWFVSRFNYQIWRFAALFVLGLAILLLLAVLVVGEERNGAKRWLDLGFVDFQPSEMAKVGMVMTYAALMSMWKDKIHEFKYGIPFVGILGVIVLLLVFQPHLSAIIIITAVAAVMMYQGGVNKWWFALGAAVAALGLVLFLTVMDYSSDRVTAWLDPDNPDYARTIAYQINQSRMAIGSGGLTGLGFGKSRQKYLYLPEEHNDYIFAVVCEELGFIGASVIILLFVLLIVRGYWIAMHAWDRFGSLLVSGLTTLLALQVFLNIGVVSNLLPSTGISLPFFSYGGTALLVNLAEMGLILGVSRQNTNNIRLAEKRKRKKAARQQKRDAQKRAGAKGVAPKKNDHH